MQGGVALVLAAGMLLSTGCVGGNPPAPTSPPPPATPPASPPPPQPPPATPPPSPPPAAGAGNNTGNGSAPVRHFARDLTITFTQAPVGPGATGLGCAAVDAPDVETGSDNCAFLLGNFSVLQGTATATWSAQNPTATDLEFITKMGDGPEVSARGPSPLQLALAPGVVAEGSEAWFVLHLPQEPTPGVMVQQSVTIAVAFDYRGEEPREAP